ncbi:hypothetical protein BGW80DRAFT_1446306 [Lactifluus volemus]|nr:hypothetical protein BGW80DRAFT_1446306 [Lactifluus volemus]
MRFSILTLLIVLPAAAYAARSSVLWPFGLQLEWLFYGMYLRGWTSNQGVCGNVQEQVVMNLRRGALVEWNGRHPSINDEHENGRLTAKSDNYVATSLAIHIKGNCINGAPQKAFRLRMKTEFRGTSRKKKKTGPPIVQLSEKKKAETWFCISGTENFGVTCATPAKGSSRKDDTGTTKKTKEFRNQRHRHVDAGYYIVLSLVLTRALVHNRRLHNDQKTRRHRMGVKSWQSQWTRTLDIKGEEIPKGGDGGEAVKISANASQLPKSPVAG